MVAIVGVVKPCTCSLPVHDTFFDALQLRISRLPR